MTRHAASYSVFGETARPQRPTTSLSRRPPTARTREGGQPDAYDENGNLTAKDTLSLAYDSGNRLRQLGGTHFERDADRRMTRQKGGVFDGIYQP